MQDHTTDEHNEDFEEYALTLNQAKELLTGVTFTEMEDASWTWSRPEDEGQYVALAEWDWVEIHLTKDSEGKLVLSGHHDSTGTASLEDEAANALKSWALGSKSSRGPQMASYDPDAVRRIVEDATAGYAREIEYACSWTDGKPSKITVGEQFVTVRYAGALPQAVAGPLRDDIVDDLRGKGFDYRGHMYGGGSVRIVPVEGVDD